MGNESTAGMAFDALFFSFNFPDDKIHSDKDQWSKYKLSVWHNYTVLAEDLTKAVFE